MNRTFRIVLWIVSVLAVQIPLTRWREHHMNPLRDYGVSVEKYYSPDANSSTPWLYVYCNYNRQIITPDIIWGGISYPSLKFCDVDGDGIEDIVFGNESFKQIVAFKPSTVGPPKFIVIRDDMHSKVRP